MRTIQNLPYHTFIGLTAEVVRSHSANLEGIRGSVVGETKNLLVLDTGSGVRKIPKVSCTFRFFIDKLYVDIDGKDVAYRPEERAKKLL